MACADSTQATAPVQPTAPPSSPPKSGIGFLAQVLENLDDDTLVATLEAYHPTGRPGYPARAMLRAYYAKLVLNIRYNNQLLERLRGNRKLRELCGFGDDIPSESVTSRFFQRLRSHVERQELAIPKILKEIRHYLPDLGEVVAIDGSFIPTWANGNRKPEPVDPDADWGFKNSATSKDSKPVLKFGYRVHMIADAIYGVPLSFTITKANGSEMTELPKVVKKLKAEHPWLTPHFFLGDRGYDSEDNHRTLMKQEFTPVIHIRKPQADDGLYDGLYNKKCQPLCLGNMGMEYVRTDRVSGEHQFRCPPQGCKLMGKGLVPNCRDEIWVNPDDNPRVVGPLARTNPLWKILYRKRWGIERYFRSGKHSRGLEHHSVMGMTGIRLQITASVLTWLATALARLQAGDRKRMRHMTIRVN